MKIVEGGHRSDCVIWTENPDPEELDNCGCDE